MKYISILRLFGNNKMSSVIVNVEEILELKKRLNEINKIPFKDIDFYLDGKKITVSDKTIEEWRLIGLNNTDFVTHGMHLNNLEG